MTDLWLPKSAKIQICRDYAEKLCVFLTSRKVRCGINLDATVWVKNGKGLTLQIGTYKLGDTPVSVAGGMIVQWAQGGLTPQHLARIITQECLINTVLPRDKAPSANAHHKLDEEMAFRADLERQGVELDKEKKLIEENLKPGEKFGEWRFEQ